MKTDSANGPLQASFSVLTMSIASSAAMALGLAPHPNTNEMHKDLAMAQFNIDLLVMLEAKTKGNLSEDEKSFLKSILSDLQIKFVNLQKN